MRIDNPVSPQQSVNLHSLGNGIWLPNYHATNVLSMIVSVPASGVVVLIPGVAGKRIIICSACASPNNTLGGLSSAVSYADVIRYGSGPLILSSLSAAEVASDIGTPATQRIDYPGGYDGGIDGDSIEITSPTGYSATSHTVNIAYTLSS